MKTLSLTLACLSLLVLNQCQTREIHETHGPIFRETLVQTLRKTTTVRIEEHSSPYDVEGRKWSDAGADRVYASVNLDEKARISFLKQVEFMNPASVGGYAMCLPEFHHTVRFYEDERLISTMKVCFECEIINWDACRLKCPDDFFKVLDLVVTEAGLHPKRDWKALAKGTSTFLPGPR